MRTKLLNGSKVIVKDGAFQVVHDKQRETDFLKMQLTKLDDNHYLLRKGRIKIILTASEVDRIWRRAETMKKKSLR